jgi:hypothetical protein
VVGYLKDLGLNRQAAGVAQRLVDSGPDTAARLFRFHSPLPAHFPLRNENPAMSAPAPIATGLLPDRTLIQSDGDDLSFITVRIEPKDRNPCPLADNLVHFRVSGAGEIAAVDNGNPATVESFHADFRKAFNGLALLIGRSRAGARGQVDVTATSQGLAADNAQVTTSSARTQTIIGQLRTRLP